MLRILIVDDQKSICETLKTILVPESDFEVVGVAHSGETAIELAKNLLPDLMLVDLEMPGLNGLDLTRILARYFPQIRVVILSMHEEDEYVRQALKAGAMGYLLKSTNAEDLKSSINFVSRGYSQFSPGILNKLIPYLGKEARSQNDDNCSLIPLNPKALKSTKSTISKSPQIRHKWQVYWWRWLIGNGIVWGIAILYLVFKSPTYTSEWSIAQPQLTSIAADRDRGRQKAIAPNKSTGISPATLSDNEEIFALHQRYQLLLAKPSILNQAAEKAQISDRQLGRPKIEIAEDNETLIVSIDGNSPEEAQQKAIALQEVLYRHLLPSSRLISSNRRSAIEVARSEMALNDARQKLVDFEAEIASNSLTQSLDVKAKIDLRQQQADTKSQIEQTRTQARLMANSAGIDPRIAKDASILYSDASFQKYRSEYNRSLGEFLEIDSIFQPNHPISIDKKSEIALISNSLKARAKTLLGRDFSLESLQKFNFERVGENDSYWSDLLRQITSLQSKADLLEIELNKIDSQIARLERQQNASRERISTLKELEKEVELAEKMYATDLASSQLPNSNLDRLDFLTTVGVRPSKPSKPTSPNPQLVYLVASISSLLLTIAIAYIWFDRQEEVRKLSRQKRYELQPKKISSIDLR